MNNMTPTALLILGVIISVAFYAAGLHLTYTHYPDHIAPLAGAGFMWIAWASRIPRDENSPEWYISIYRVFNAIIACSATVLLSLYLYLKLFGG